MAPAKDHFDNPIFPTCQGIDSTGDMLHHFSVDLIKDSFFSHVFGLYFEQFDQRPDGNSLHKNRKYYHHHNCQNEKPAVGKVLLDGDGEGKTNRPT